MTYLLPLRRPEGAGELDPELVCYLRAMGSRCEVIVVDGSAAPEFSAARRALTGLAEHVAPDEELQCANGKVRGVLTGMRRVRTSWVVIGDDDVRYDGIALRQVEELLQVHDVVVPQNFFFPRPWHAVWDTGRTLLNRSVGRDLPGTVALRRDVFERSDGYDGDVLFENLELIRTAQAVGARCASPLDLYVQRLPPSFGKFMEQRVRQAYDELARPHRLTAGLAILPVVVAVGRRRKVHLIAVVAGVVALAERGRRRAGGRTVFAWQASACAPLWVLERGVCSWIALGQRLVGGCPYAGTRVRRAANSRAELIRRHGGLAHAAPRQGPS